MGQRRILFISDFGKTGSGYLSISAPLCQGLTMFGYDVKVLGLRYSGEEHTFNFSIVPCGESMQEIKVKIENLAVLWPFDVLVVAGDIPVHRALLAALDNRKFKYIAITPLEMGPLSYGWAASLSSADKVFFISELGKNEAQKTGLAAEHLVVGINTNHWFPMTLDERISARQLLGYTDNDLVVLMVMDNQERKNLSAGYKTISLLKQMVNGDTRIRGILITRIQSPSGWDLADVRQIYGLARDDIREYERGMTTEQLRMFYCIADVFFLPSKAEGLGLPVLEAMSCGVPVVATNTGALTELLADGRGMLVDYEYEIECDVWGCSKRRFISPQDAANKIATLFSDDHDTVEMIRKARDYVVSRTMIGMVKQVVDAVEEVCK